MYIIWLPVWYLQTFLISSSSKYLESHSRKCIFYFFFQPISVIANTFNLASSSIEVRHLFVHFLWLFDCCKRNFTIHNFTVAYMCRPSILVLSTESIYRDRQHVTTTPCNRGLWCLTPLSTVFQVYLGGSPCNHVTCWWNHS